MSGQRPVKNEHQARWVWWIDRSTMVNSSSFQEQEVGPVDSYYKIDRQLLAPWLPCSVIIIGISSLERLSAQVHCNLGPISSLIPMRHFGENGSSVIAEICSLPESIDLCSCSVYDI